jgi:methionine-rich copper-binding protein CopC
MHYPKKSTSAFEQKSRRDISLPAHVKVDSTTESDYTADVNFGAQPSLSFLRRSFRARRFVACVASCTFAALATIGLHAPAASAAPILVRTTPPQDSVLEQVPSRVVFTFDTPLIRFGTGAYLNGDKLTTPLAERSDQPNEAILRLDSLSPTAPGVYDIVWQAFAEDESTTGGQLRFRVGPVPTKATPPPTTGKAKSKNPGGKPLPTIPVGKRKPTTTVARSTSVSPPGSPPSSPVTTVATAAPGPIVANESPTSATPAVTSTIVVATPPGSDTAPSTTPSNSAPTSAPVPIAPDGSTTSPSSVTALPNSAQIPVTTQTASEPPVGRKPSTTQPLATKSTTTKPKRSTTTTTEAITTTEETTEAPTAPPTTTTPASTKALPTKTTAPATTLATRATAPKTTGAPSTQTTTPAATPTVTLDPANNPAPTPGTGIASGDYLPDPSPQVPGDAADPGLDTPIPGSLLPTTTKVKRFSLPKTSTSKTSRPTTSRATTSREQTSQPATSKTPTSRPQTSKLKASTTGDKSNIKSPVTTFPASNPTTTGKSTTQARNPATPKPSISKSKTSDSTSQIAAGKSKIFGSTDLGWLRTAILAIGALFGLMLLGTMASLALPSSAPRRGTVLVQSALATAVAILLMSFAGIARGLKNLPTGRTSLIAKIIGGLALLAVALFRWRSLRRGVKVVLDRTDSTSKLPFSLSRKSRNEKHGRHYGITKTVGRATLIEGILLLAALVVAVVLMAS